MNLKMVPVAIIGLKADLVHFLAVIRDLGCIHIDGVSESQDIMARPLVLDGEGVKGQEELNLLAARIDGLIEILNQYPNPVKTAADSESIPNIAVISQHIENLLPIVQSLSRKCGELESERASLPLYEATMRKLMPLLPVTAYESGNVVVGTLVNRANVAVLDLVGKQVLEVTRGEATIVSRDVDEFSRAMLIVVAKNFLPEVESLLGQKDVSRLRLPPELGEGLPDVMLESIQRRLREIPQEQAKVEAELSQVASVHLHRLLVWQTILDDEMEGYSVLSRFGETDTTFVLTGWIPKDDLVRVKQALQKELGEMVYLQELPFPDEMEARAPIILQNPPPARPFESLVRLLALPEYGRTDPTILMSVFLPVFFGLMLGDIAYGLILLAISLVLSRKFKTGFAHDLMIIIAMGSAWAILFGILFGEVFGTLGEDLGLHPIWMARDSAEDVQGLLLMTVAIGAGHVTLGLVLGVYDAIRARSRTHLLERGGMLLGLVSLFFMVAVLVDFLPPGFMTPAVAGLILGIVLLGASLGWLGVLMGPIEFIGLIGNVLSYLRIAAIGLASVYLAKVANEMAGMVGSLVVGLILAVLIHALNLVLGVFSPTIHSLRLHYVEFFRKFYEGGGRPYEPFRSHLT